MDYSHRLEISFYKPVAPINAEHGITLMQHQETGKFCVCKKTSVYNLNIYEALYNTPIKGIPRIIAFHEEDNVLTILEEYISGRTLQEIMHAETLSTSQITGYLLELCDILAQLHSMNPPIIHRDIKPSNLMITSSGQLMLLDFNAAKAFSETDSEDTVLLGTKGYAAPEQYGFGSSTPQTDIYAIGVLLKELTDECTHSVFAPIIDRCTQLNPADRYKDVAALTSSLSKLNSGDHRDTGNTCGSSPALPGFRSKTPWKMAVATIGYALIVFVAASLTVKDVSAPVLWLNRITALLVMLAIVFGCCNYLGIQKFCPLCDHDNRLIRLFGIALLDFALIFVLFLILLILESFFPNAQAITSAAYQYSSILN